MLRKLLLLKSLMIALFLLASCKPEAIMPNPASVFCEENNGKLEIREDQDGGQVGYCLFPDGSACEEWAFYRGECKPGDSLAPIADMPNPASVFCEENDGILNIVTDAFGAQLGLCTFEDGTACEEWAFFRGECQIGGIYLVTEIAGDGCKIYRNQTAGFSFHFPADATITSAGDPNHTLTVQGPLTDDEYWPMIFINSPIDRPAFTLPANTELAGWLESNNLLVGERQQDVSISSVNAIHLRQEGSEQTFPSDHFFFAEGDRIFNVVILHTGNQEDWELYNHFLASFEVN